MSRSHSRRSAAPRRRRAAALGVAAVLGVLGLLAAVLVVLLRDGPADGGTAELLRRPATPGADAALPGAANPLDERGAPEAPPVAPVRPEPIARLGPELIIGRVVDRETRKPVAAFQVDVLPHDPRPPLERLEPAAGMPFRARSGIFEVEREPGLYDVVVRAPKYRPTVLQAVEVPAADARPIPIEMDHGPSIVGEVYDVHGLAARDVEVFLEVVRLDLDGPAPLSRLDRTDEAGAFRFSPLPLGEYALTLHEPDNRVDRLAPVHVTGGTTAVRMPLSPRHEVLVRLQDPQGRPVGGAWVELKNEQRLFSERSEAPGQVVFRHVPDGRYAVAVRCDGFEPYEDELLLEGSQGQVVRWITLGRPPGS